MDAANQVRKTVPDLLSCYIRQNAFYLIYCNFFERTICYVIYALSNSRLFGIDMGANPNRLGLILACSR
jgi:hypothetical protein